MNWGFAGIFSNIFLINLIFIWDTVALYFMFFWLFWLLCGAPKNHIFLFFSLKKTEHTVFFKIRSES